MPGLHSDWKGDAASRRKLAAYWTNLALPTGRCLSCFPQPSRRCWNMLNGASFLLMAAKESQQDQPADSSAD